MWLEIGVVVLLLIALAQCFALVLLWRQGRHLRTAVMALSHSAACATDVPTSMLVSTMGRIERRIAMLELPVATTPRPPYELAQQLAREGADISQLIVRCGLSSDEAKLIVQMHPATH